MLVQLGLLSSAAVRLLPGVEPLPHSVANAYVYWIGFALTVITVSGRVLDLRERRWKW
jgi:hypothetical protein